MLKICGDCGATYIGDVCLMLPCEQKREEDDMTMGPKDAGWDEYDAAAEDLARRGLRGDAGDALPFGLSARVMDAINADPEAFAERVRGFAYARSMNEAEDN